MQGDASSLEDDLATKEVRTAEAAAAKRADQKRQLLRLRQTGDTHVRTACLP
jgi:hypothetical protein